MANGTGTKFSTTIISITGLITALGGIITVLYNVGILEGRKKAEEPQVHYKKIVEELIEEETSKVKEVVPSQVVVDTKPAITKVVHQPKKKVQDVTGYWFDSDDANAKYYFEQINSKITFTEYTQVFGQWTASASGSGTINNNKIKLSYTTYIGSRGEFTGKLTNSGKKMQGNIRDFDLGGTAAMRLRKEE